MSRYRKWNSDEWVKPVRKGFRFACCDCSLVHNMDFRVTKGRVQFRVRRNNRATYAMRRHRPIVARKNIPTQRKAMRAAKR